MSRGLLLSLSLSLLIAGTAFAQGTPSPQINFEQAAVVASGLTPGKTVVWFGIEHVIDAEYSGDITQYCHEATVASDGTARLDLAHDVVTRSLWLAVDLDTGGYALAAPVGYRIAPLETAPQLIRLAGTPDLLSTHASYIEGLVVRPGVGAWTFAGTDSGPGDADGLSDGNLSLAVNQSDPLPGSSVAPDQVATDDLSFLVDPVLMRISVLKGGIVQ
jgi:hypothetical protein